MSKFTKFFLLVVLLFSITNISTVQAQNKRTVLERKKSRLKSDIDYKNTLLKKTEKEKSTTLNQLVLLRDKIAKREELIGTINSEVKYLDSEIDKNEELIASMERDIATLKEEYAKMIQFAYRNRSNYDKIMYVFASEDFNQAYKRLRYLQQYSEFRKKQTEDIRHLEGMLVKKNAELLAEIAEKQSLLQNETKEKTTLAKEKTQQQKVLTNLQTQEKELRKEILAKQKEQEQLQKAIQTLIAEEIRLAQQQNSSNTGEWKLTPEAAALANSFTANKGKLPWPVEAGTITDKFGVHSHPVLKNIKIRNDGVGISTKEGTTARAVFEGQVTKILIIPGAGKVVIIRHGDYLTVYGNLKDVYVTSGDNVKIKQILGEILTNRDKTELQFEIRKGKEAITLDPTYWLFQAR